MRAVFADFANWCGFDMTRDAVSDISIDVGCQAGVGSEEWDEYVMRHSRSTFFHLSGWQRVLEKTFPYQSCSMTAIRDGRICGILPLYRVKRLPFGSSLISSPLAVYGGICADDREVALALMARAQELGHELKVGYLELRNQESLGDLPTSELYATFRREIYRDEEENMAAIPRNQRRSIRIGKKQDLSARFGRKDLLKDFVDIYSHSVRNLGSPVYPYRLFENLLDEFQESCKIVGVFKDGQMVAGVLTFFFKDQVMPYYGGAYKHAYRYSVYDFMYWSLMCFGAESGFTVFDFGRSKRGSGSYDFKRHWGFEPTSLPYQYFLVNQRKVPNLSPSNPKFSLPIKIWKKLPVKLTRWLGPKLVKYFP